jgi:GNAT superfamily N-acetyltransferase
MEKLVGDIPTKTPIRLPVFQGLRVLSAQGIDARISATEAWTLRRVDIRFGMDEVIRADRGAVEALSQMLTRAFASDPIACDLFPKARGRRRRVERFFAIQLRHTYLPRGEVLTFSDLSAAALVIWPNAPTLGLRHQLATVRAVVLLGRRVIAAQELARTIMATHPSGPYAYLGTIGTDPVAQRSGRATRLIEAIVARCDREGLLCCIEASTQSNVEFYERFGFVQERALPIRVGGPTLFVMRRAAKPRDSIPT